MLTAKEAITRLKEGNEKYIAADTFWAAIHHDPSGFIKFITDEVKTAIGDETDDLRASILNVKHSIGMIESSLEIQKDEEAGLMVAGAIYDIETGKVTFLE